jgi:hypothetical protein
LFSALVICSIDWDTIKSATQCIPLWWQLERRVGQSWTGQKQVTMSFVVLLDANVLFPFTLRDFLVALATTEL